MNRSADSACYFDDTAGVRAIRANANGELSMADPNPMTVIADCIEKSKASTDPELISDYIAEALGVLQTESTEDDAFNMLGSAIIDAVADDPTHTEALLEVWSELGEQRKLQ